MKESHSLSQVPHCVVYFYIGGYLHVAKSMVHISLWAVVMFVFLSTVCTKLEVCWRHSFMVVFIITANVHFPVHFRSALFYLALLSVFYVNFKGLICNCLDYSEIKQYMFLCCKCFLVYLLKINIQRVLLEIFCSPNVIECESSSAGYGLCDMTLLSTEFVTAISLSWL